MRRSYEQPASSSPTEPFFLSMTPGRHHGGTALRSTTDTSTGDNNINNNNIDGMSVRTSRRRFDVTSAMNRLRNSMIGRADDDDEDDEEDNDDDVDDVMPGDGNELLLSHGENVDTMHCDDATGSNNAPTLQLSGKAPHHPPRRKRRGQQTRTRRTTINILRQIPAILLIALFHLMIGIPFGVSYFPIGWNNDNPHIMTMTSSATTTTKNTTAIIITSGGGDGGIMVNGPFPLPTAKESLGIRMFLFSTIVGQVVFTIFSGFDNPIGLQMVENVPFCHELASIAIAHAGYGMSALTTLMVMFGLSSLLVGLVFYTLGKLKLGRIVYFFPTHVLVGCIGGIGIFIAKTGVEVTISTTFDMLLPHMDLFGVVLLFEGCLRILERVTREDNNGKPRYALLAPIYFCLITPIFYGALWILHVDMDAAQEAGYFFPPLDACDNTMRDCPESTSWRDVVFNDDLFDMWRVINPSAISWSAIAASGPTLIALTLFSLIHVPINIPAFAISTNTEADMNVELVAHGYSNLIAGAFGGLQNYMAYTQSVLYHKSGGAGKVSGFCVAMVTSLLFLVGPAIASYIPRCMAGTLLLHVGIDLFLEGVLDSYGKFDRLEYSGIWLIVIVMTCLGMDAAMIAGAIAAVSTYVVQNVTYLNPIRGTMSAVTLRSSRWNRSHAQMTILNDKFNGRIRILVVQLQGHLFFANMAQLTETINKVMVQKLECDQKPWIVIMDFSLVLGIDSSAGQAISKMQKNVLMRKYQVELRIFVSGSPNGFPTEFPLQTELASEQNNEHTKKRPGTDSESTPLLNKEYAPMKSSFEGSHVCESLDEALMLAEDGLIFRQDSSLLEDPLLTSQSSERQASWTDEKQVALQYVRKLCPEEAQERDCEGLLSLFEREEYEQDDVVWKQGSPGNSAKLLVSGTLIAILEYEAGTSETVGAGNMVGELGLVQNIPRMSSLICQSPDAVMYSLSRKSYLYLIENEPKIARFVDLICVKYLAARVQHVSNRIVETR